MGGDGAASGVPAARRNGYKSGNARREPLEEQRARETEDGLHPLHRRLPAFPPPGPRSLRTLLVQHPGELRVNPDASRFCAALEIAGIAGRVPGALGGCSGNAGRPHAAIPLERTKRTPQRSRFGRGRSACRYTPASCSVRRERSELYRASSVGNRPTSHRQTSRWGAILRLHLCLSRWGARHSDRTCRFTRCRARFLFGVTAYSFSGTSAALPQGRVLRRAAAFTAKRPRNRESTTRGGGKRG
jgi:hypothetical protein